MNVSVRVSAVRKKQNRSWRVSAGRWTYVEQLFRLAALSMQPSVHVSVNDGTAAADDVAVWPSTWTTLAANAANATSVSVFFNSAIVLDKRMGSPLCANVVVDGILQALQAAATVSQSRTVGVRTYVHPGPESARDEGSMTPLMACAEG